MDEFEKSNGASVQHLCISNANKNRELDGKSVPMINPQLRKNNAYKYFDKP